MFELSMTGTQGSRPSQIGLVQLFLWQLVGIDGQTRFKIPDSCRGGGLFLVR